MSAVYFSNGLSIYDLGHDNLYDFVLNNTTQHYLDELKDKSFLDIKITAYINEFLQSCKAKSH